MALGRDLGMAAVSDGPRLRNGTVVRRISNPEKTVTLVKTVDRSFITARKSNSAPSIPPAVNSTASLIVSNPDPELTHRFPRRAFFLAAILGSV